MNKRFDWFEAKQDGNDRPIRKRIDKRVKDVLLLGILAIGLCFAAWKIFYEDPSDTFVATSASENEKRVGQLLSEIAGVGKANVMICETEEGVQSVVVVCDGADNLQVVMDIREAVAAATGADEKSIKIYLKKE